MANATEEHAALYLFDLLNECGLPLPVREHHFHPQRDYRFDFSWPEIKVAVESHGGVWVQGRHTRGKGFLADREKCNEAQLMGWIVLEFSPDQITSQYAITYIQKALKQRLNK